MSGWDVGVAVLDFAREELSARKAWFSLGDTVWCLGAGIVGDAKEGYATTVNQSFARGAVRIGGAAGDELREDGGRALTTGSRVEHDCWVYRLHDAERACVEVRGVTGHWNRVYTNPTTPPAPVSGRLFTLLIDHGSKPQGASYAYSATLAGQAERGRLLANTPAIQVAQDEDAGTLAVVFWEPGEWRRPDGGSLGADAPCIVLLRAGQVWVVEPTQKRAHLTLRIDGVERRVELPQGAAAGTAVELAAVPAILPTR